MALSIDEVQKVAKLARIKLTDEEITKYRYELNKIMDWVEQLNKVDTKGVKPLSSVVLHDLQMREDIMDTTDYSDIILKNAPLKKYNCFVVPKVVE